MAHDDLAGTRCHTLMQFSGEALDPESVSRLIALQPFSSKKRGEPVALPRPGRPAPLARRGVISYSTHTIIGDNINDHLRFLLNAIVPASEQLKALVNKDRLHWGIVLFIDDSPADWRALVEKPVADTLDGLGIELELDDPSTITVVEET
jgi:hypothetical protein